jgi:ubiquinone/menaquinone biosynthesis C-methylase UbiE
MSEATHLDVDQAVRDRYEEAAQSRQPALCCPVDYDPQYLAVIPQEVLDRDYGCGDPSRYVRPGDTVLDLGSGGGKICFIASQIVGREGRVIGVDVNDEMLELARKSAPEVASRVGYANVEFVRGQIQDLALSLDSLDDHLKEHPIQRASDLVRLEDLQARLRAGDPLIPDGSVDIVVSNCVLNLVRPEHKGQLIREIFRVLKRGGRIAISDIVSDEEIPAGLRNDSELWSGCVSGAFQEMELMRELEAAGFYGIEIDVWTEEPFAVVEGIEFRSLTVTARKGKEGACYEANHAVVYRAPWSEVRDDDGHGLKRGERTAVCAKTFELFTQEPYAGHLVGIAPQELIPEGERELFDCARSVVRDPRETKGGDYSVTRKPSASGGCC